MSALVRLAVVIDVVDEYPGGRQSTMEYARELVLKAVQNLIKEKLNVALYENPSMKRVVCPQCGHDFDLSYDEYGHTETLRIDSCLSGGVYGVSIECPK